MTTSGWSGVFEFGDLWAAYRGPVAGHTPHAHAAVQVVVSERDDASVQTPGARPVRGRVLIVPALCAHTIEASGRVGLLYVEAESAFGRRLRERTTGSATAIRAAQRGNTVRIDDPPREWLRELAPDPAQEPRRPDPRLLAALERLGRDPASWRLDAVAREVGLSPARLREIARTELGVPLATWRLWRKLDQAARRIAAGDAIGVAAVDAGFADQAHLSRTMRQLFGITPSDAVPSLRGHDEASATRDSFKRQGPSRP